MVYEIAAAKQSDQQKNRWDKKRNWHGVDLDGTLALWSGWKGSTHIGPPVPAMLERVKKWLKKGEKVKIFTARVNDLLLERKLNETKSDEKAWKDWKEDQDVRNAIREWCWKWIGLPLPVTNSKDQWMVDLWDDRAQGIQPNTGKIKGAGLVARLSTKPSQSN